MRKTERGYLILTLGGGQEMPKALEGEIKDNVEEVQVTTKRVGTTILYVMGIEQTITEEEVRDAIARETKIKIFDIAIKATRKGKYEEHTMIVEVPKGSVEELIKKRKLQICWSECGIKEKIHVMRCFKCLEYGHRTRECEAQVDRREECLKCGENGHKSKECENETRCVKCDIKGHRADQMKCPFFKGMVEGLRKQKIQAMDRRTEAGAKNRHAY